MAKILVVEDSEEFQLTIQASLGPDHEVICLSGADRIVENVLQEKPDLILMDIDLPNVSGKEACKHLQRTSRTNQIPLLFVTGFRAPKDLAEGLELGAEDYITKPFDPIELRARCEARLKKAKASMDREIWVRRSPLSMNILSRKAYCQNDATQNEDEIDLTPGEFQLLLYLAKNSGRDISRREIESELASDSKRHSKTRVIDAQIKAIRTKAPLLASCIVSIYGVGYRFVPRTANAT